MAISRNLVVVAALIAVCGIVGAAVYVHDRNAPSSTAINPAVMSNTAGQAADGQTNPTDGYYPSMPRPVYVRQAEPTERELAEDRQPYYRERDGSGDRRRRHGRSKTHSVEIVAGSAAAGAAIGAIAGGGTGAAIGALSGGGAGFAYDRMTHNK
jgi:hypothetical protein